MSTTAPHAAVGGALLVRVAPNVGRPLEKEADLRTAVIGYPKAYHYGDQRAALDELERLKAAGKPFAELSADARNILAKSNNSFAGPTFATMTALRNAGVGVDAFPIYPGVYPRKGLPPIVDPDRINRIVRRVAADPRYGSVIQIGALSPENADILASSGKHFGRLATDYGSGGFLQPRYHLGGHGTEGTINGMLIDPTVKYDSIYVPGGKLLPWKGIPASAASRIVPTGRLAVAPMFGAAEFTQSRPAGGIAKVLMTTGGGSGLGLPFEQHLQGGLGATTSTSLMSPAPNLLDHLLTALRKKHGDGRFTLDFLTGLDPADMSKMLTPADYQYLISRARMVGAPPAYIGGDLWALRHLLNPESPVYQATARTPDGRRLIEGLAQRYRGLNLLGRVALPDMVKYYGNADTIVDLPGSSLGEIAQMRGTKSPGMIHLVPQETPLYPQHFYGNALATNALMQPGAKHNIVRVGSPTLAQDIDRAVQEAGFKDWGRKPAMSAAESMRPLVNDILRAHARREFRNAGSQAMKSLWKIIRHIK